AAGIEEAELDARLLLEFVCGTNRNTLLVHDDRPVTDEETAAYRELTGKRAQRIPLQHLTGTQDFMGLEFEVNEHVLIPRQDTEILVEEALQELHDGMRVLDMCTGSGCILISLLRYSNDCTGVGADISEEALQVARRNAKKLLADGSIIFVQSDLFERVEGQFDMIVSNPPYICTDVIETLMPEVREHEPRQALDGSADGLLFYRRIIEDSVKYLKRGGMLFFEIGYDQGEAVKKLMEQAGYLEVHVIRDYAGLDRVVAGTLGFGITV
ncbi:MAG: peptide chain release factor N(5)-glutamine methyltransferase, partial [Acetatifactor sp.]